MAYPRAYRQLAYEIWRDNRLRTATEVAQELNRVLALDSEVEMPVDTVMDWKNRDGWEQKWGLEVLGSSPQVVERIIAGVSVGTLHAVEYLTQVVNKEIPVDKDIDGLRINAARILVQSEIALITAAQRTNKRDKRKTNLSITPATSTEDLLALESQARNASP